MACLGWMSVVRRIKYMDCMLLLCCYIIAELMRFCGRVESTGELGLVLFQGTVGP